MRWNRRQYIDLMTFGDAPRPMFVELFGLLIGLEEEWRGQGATQDEIDLVAFDFDTIQRVGVGIHTGLRGGYVPATLEETDPYVITRDELGRTMKLLKGFATIALPLSFPVTDFESWERVKPFYTFAEDRVDREQLQRAKAEQRDGALTMAGIPGGYDTLRELMGEEMACVACYEQPDLVRDILDTLRDTALRCLERAVDVVPLDHLGVHEDMAGKSGPLFGPKQIGEFLKPYYSACWDVARSSGCRLFSQDSDGNMSAVVGSFADCGLTVMYPCEPASGMDMVALRKRYGGQMAFKGGIDKFCVMRGRDAIVKELEYKMQPCMRKGVCFGLDHRIPNGTPLEDYRFYVDTAREMLGIPKRTKDARAWERMAF